MPELPEGWTWVTLEYIGDAIDPQPIHRTPPKFEGGIPYIGISDFNEKTGEIDFNKARKVHADILNEHINRYCLEEGDFVIGKIGTIGKPFQIPSDRFFTLSANIVLVKATKSIVKSDYLFHTTKSPLIERQFSKGSKATTQAAFGIQKVRLLFISFCGAKEQSEIIQQIGSRLSVIEKLEQDIEDGLKKAEILCQSLLKKAFEGRLVAQDPNDEPASVLLERIKAEKAEMVKKTR